MVYLIIKLIINDSLMKVESIAGSFCNIFDLH